MKSESKQDLLTLTNSITSSPSNDETIITLIKKAQIAYELNKHQEAISYCNTILAEHDSINKEAYLLTIKILIDNNEFDLATQLRLKISKEIIHNKSDEMLFTPVFLELESKIKEQTQLIQFCKDKAKSENIALFLSSGWVNLTIVTGIFALSCYLFKKAINSN